VHVGNEAYMQANQIGVEPAAQSDAQRLQSAGEIVVFLAVDGELVGAIAVADPIKETARQALDALRAEGMEVVMLTGGSCGGRPNAVAEKLGITKVYAGVLPTEKLAVIEELRQGGHVVAMAGDGVNDSAGLAGADVGIAMGTGTDIAIQNADVVLVGGDLSGILRALKLSRATMTNIKQKPGSGVRL